MLKGQKSECIKSLSTKSDYALIEIREFLIPPANLTQKETKLFNFVFYSTLALIASTKNI